ncbi:MAG: thioredoxin fold domain-containing protein, partial [Campylobacterota bacterium]|nr:thioredoxin fold domain-containing protein [Campylobacterota bacterium]
QPLGFLKGSASSGVALSQKSELDFVVVNSIAELDALLEKNKGKKIMLDFSAEWCVACKELEEITFADARVQAKLDEYILIRADVTANSADEKALMKKYGVFGPPALIFFDENIEVKSAKTIIGFIEPEKFLTHLENI